MPTKRLRREGCLERDLMQHVVNTMVSSILIGPIGDASSTCTESLTRCVVRLTRLQNPAYTARIAAII